MKTKLIVSFVIAVALAAGALWYVLGSTWSAQTNRENNFPAQASQLRELKEQWRKVIDQQGPEKAYAAFLEAALSNPIEPHSQAHAFGEALYDAEGISGLSTCDSSFEFGCYHSFFGAAVYAEGIGTLPQFDEACKKKYGDMNLPCQHGIGHGVIVYTDYNLEDALVLCETISTLPTGGCSSGVFMEYNFHTMDESADGKFVRELTENPYEPCDTLPQRFQASCYFEQVQWWQNVYSGNFEKIGALCAALESDAANFNACYNGAGNYIAATARFELKNIVGLCALMPSANGVGLCHEGASWLIRGEQNGEASAQELCMLLEEPHQSQCLQKLQ